MKKRLIGLFFAIIMMMSALPMTVSAEELITEVEILNVIEPVIGEVARFDYSLPEGVNYEYREDSGVYGCWGVSDTAVETEEDLYNIDVYAGDDVLVFEGGKYYVFAAWIQPKEGFAFSNDATATLNGEAAKLFLSEIEFPTVWYSFYLPFENEIMSVSVDSVVAPVAGKTATFDFNIPENVPYIKWIDDTGYTNWAVTESIPESMDEIMESDWLYDPAYGPDSDDIESSLVFEEGKYYTFLAWVETENCVFTSNIECTLNGEAAKFYCSSTNQGCVYFTFYCDAAPEYLYGDVNLDGKVSPLDASLVLQYNAQLVNTLDCLEAADVNLDGKISPLDASLILQYNAQLIPSLPF